MAPLNRSPEESSHYEVMWLASGSFSLGMGTDPGWPLGSFKLRALAPLTIKLPSSRFKFRFLDFWVMLVLPSAHLMSPRSDVNVPPVQLHHFLVMWTCCWQYWKSLRSDTLVPLTGEAAAATGTNLLGGSALGLSSLVNWNLNNHFPSVPIPNPHQQGKLFSGRASALHL